MSNMQKRERVEASLGFHFFLFHYLIVTIVAPNPYSWKEAS